MMPTIAKAVHTLRAAGVTPSWYSCYVLVKDVEDALERVEFLRNLKVDPFAQPYRDFSNNIEPTQEQKDFARWVNRKQLFRATRWKDYKPRSKTSIS